MEYAAFDEMIIFRISETMLRNYCFRNTATSNQLTLSEKVISYFRVAVEQFLLYSEN